MIRFRFYSGKQEGVELGNNSELQNFIELRRNILQQCYCRLSEHSFIYS